MKILCIQLTVILAIYNVFTLLMYILFNEYCRQMSYKLDSRSVYWPQNDTYIWIKLNLIWLLCFYNCFFLQIKICDEQVMQLFIHDVNYIDNMTKLLVVYK